MTAREMVRAGCFNRLDPGAGRGLRTVLHKLARSRKSRLLVTHHLADLLPEIERVVLMPSGRIVTDGAAALKIWRPDQYR